MPDKAQYTVQGATNEENSNARYLLRLGCIGLALLFGLAYGTWRVQELVCPL